MDRTLERFYSGRTVLVTGFTGEAGSWLMQALLMLGADVVGFGVNRTEKGSSFGTGKSLFDLSGLTARSEHDRTAPKKEGAPRFHAVTGSVKDLYLCRETFMKTEPEIVFHLAPGLYGAALLAGNSRSAAFHRVAGLSEMEPDFPGDPVRTYEEAVLGTVHVLDCVRTTTTEFGGDTGRRCVRSFVYIAGNGAERGEKAGRNALCCSLREPGIDVPRSQCSELETDARCSALEAVKTWRHCYFEGEGAAGVCAVVGGGGNPPALVRACLDAGMRHYDHPGEEGTITLPDETAWSGQERFLRVRGEHPERIPAEMRAILNEVLSV